MYQYQSFDTQKRIPEWLSTIFCWILFRNVSNPYVSIQVSLIPIAEKIFYSCQFLAPISTTLAFLKDILIWILYQFWYAVRRQFPLGLFEGCSSNSEGFKFWHYSVWNLKLRPRYYYENLLHKLRNNKVSFRPLLRYRAVKLTLCKPRRIIVRSCV